MFHKRPHPHPAPGVPAARIADLLECFGVNTFSSTDPDSNRWGSWPADYSPASVIAGLKWLTGDSGLTIQLREYHYADRDWQAAWCAEVHAATGSKFTVAIGAGGGMNDVASLITLASDTSTGISWIEGINEPNNDFGSGPLPVADVVAVQVALVQANVPPIMGPSIVFGLPNPAGYITGYASGADLSSIITQSAICNAHVYPPSHVDLDDGSGQSTMRDIVRGLGVAYSGQPIAITEWHPTLYNTQGHALDPVYDAYYAPCFMLSAFQEGVIGCWWYALFDYGDVFKSGLFPKTGGVDPRPVAETIRAMFILTGDTGANKRTFTPGSLAYTVSGASTVRHALFQNSAGMFFLFVYDVRAEPDGVVSFPVLVGFANGAPVSIMRYKISDASSPEAPTTVRQGTSRAASIGWDLNASVHLLVIKP